MKLGGRRRMVGLLAAATVAATSVGAALTRTASTAEASNRPTPAMLARCPWLDSKLPVATRVSMLLRAMTPLDEATLLHLRQIDTTVPYEGYTPAIPSLCVPAISEQDGAAGVAMGFPGVTQLPAPVADAAAFDPALAQRYGAVIGSEDAAKGVDLALAPTLNIDRSPLWGRSYETLGEDPYLTASLAVPLVRGIQANRVGAVLKHFAVYNQEAHRGTLLDDSVVGDQALHEIYLPAFSAAVQSGQAAAVMCSYNLVNGTPACENQGLLDGILRRDWHFTGFVRSDCGSIFHQSAAIAAGVSQVKCTRLYSPTTLASPAAAGGLSKPVLDALAQPLLTVLFDYELIAQPHPFDREEVVTGAAHRAVALATDDEGTVLLKNAGGALPLNLSKLGSLALIGPDNGTPMPAGYGAMHVLPTRPVSTLAALRAAMGDRVHYSDGSNLADAVETARHAGAAVVVVHDVEAERRDRSTLALPAGQDELVRAVAAANPDTIVVLETGSAVLMPWLSSVRAVLETWYPGEQAGTSLVHLLSGRVDPSGKLPVTFPGSPLAMPDNTASTFGGTGGHTVYADGIDVGYRWYEAHGTAPAFPFGYGLSYTRFRFSNLTVQPDGSGGAAVRATITNVGSVRGADVVQCYLGDPPGLGEPDRQLRAFSRVDLMPHQSQTVRMTLTPGDLATWDTTAKQWVVAGGAYRLWVGDGSDLAELPLTATVQVDAASLGPNSGPGPR